MKRLWFPDYYYGFLPDLDTFRKAYEMPADEYLQQSYDPVGGVVVCVWGGLHRDSHWSGRTFT
jgi:hypothetical protein